MLYVLVFGLPLIWVLLDYWTDLNSPTKILSEAEQLLLIDSAKSLRWVVVPVLGFALVSLRLSIGFIGALVRFTRNKKRSSL